MNAKKIHPYFSYILHIHIIVNMVSEPGTKVLDLCLVPFVYI